MPHATPARRFWIVNASIWAVYGAASIGMGAAFAGHASSGIVFVSIALAGLLFAASVLLRALALRGGWLEMDVGASAIRLAVAVAAFAAAAQGLMAAMLVPAVRLGWVSFDGVGTGYSTGTVIGYWINTMILLALWTGTWVGWRSIRRARASEMTALRAESERHLLEFDALRARLNPHFVFNALNNLRALILEDPERARELVTRLSNTLRHALEHSQREWTTLQAEVEVVEDYLAVEAVHYEERLRPAIMVEPAARGARIPPMALQLLVENAIKHGIACTPGGGELSIHASRDRDVLEVRVANPGRLDAGGAGTGVGLAFLRNRVQRAGARFDIAEDAGRVVATLEIPQ